MLVMLGIVKTCNKFSSPVFAEIEVSGHSDTWLEAELHWTGAFSGSQHDEYIIYFVKKHWFSSPERKRVCSRDGYSGDIVDFRKASDGDIEFVRYQSLAEQKSRMGGEVLMRFTTTDFSPR